MWCGCSIYIWLWLQTKIKELPCKLHGRHSKTSSISAENLYVGKLYYFSRIYLLHIVSLCDFQEATSYFIFNSLRNRIFAVMQDVRIIWQYIKGVTQILKLPDQHKLAFMRKKWEAGRVSVYWGKWRFTLFMNLKTFQVIW